MMRKFIDIFSFVLLLSVAGCRQSAVDEWVPDAPIYTQHSQWYITDRNAPVDVFYVISTEIGDYTRQGRACHFADTYNDSVRIAMRAEMVGVDTLIGGRLNFYSPFYRQCSLQTFTGDSLINARMPLAGGDVRRAFKHYLKHYNGGRPFVLAGFSQGAMLVKTLLREMDDTTAARMVAAYVIGAVVTADELKTTPRLVPATRADDVGVTVCYNSARDVNSSLWGSSAVGINPVNWRTDSVPAMLVTEPSPLLPVARQQPDTMTVHLDPVGRVAIVEGYRADDYQIPLIGKDGCYHSREIWLYRHQLRDNIALRAARFLETR